MTKEELKKTNGTIRVKVNTTCPICGDLVDVADSFYCIDDPVDPFLVRENKLDHEVKCPVCESEFIIDCLEF